MQNGGGAAAWGRVRINGVFAGSGGIQFVQPGEYRDYGVEAGYSGWGEIPVEVFAGPSYESQAFVFSTLVPRGSDAANDIRVVPMAAMPAPRYCGIKVQNDSSTPKTVAAAITYTDGSTEFLTAEIAAGSTDVLGFVVPEGKTVSKVDWSWLSLTTETMPDGNTVYTSSEAGVLGTYSGQIPLSQGPADVAQLAVIGSGASSPPISTGTGGTDPVEFQTQATTAAEQIAQQAAQANAKGLAELGDRISQGLKGVVDAVNKNGGGSGTGTGTGEYAGVLAAINSDTMGILQQCTLTANGLVGVSNVVDSVRIAATNMLSVLTNTYGWTTNMYGTNAAATEEAMRAIRGGNFFELTNAACGIAAGLGTEFDGVAAGLGAGGAGAPNSMQEHSFSGSGWKVQAGNFQVDLNPTSYGWFMEIAAFTRHLIAWMLVVFHLGACWTILSHHMLQSALVPQRSFSFATLFGNAMGNFPIAMAIAVSITMVLAAAPVVMLGVFKHGSFVGTLAAGPFSAAGGVVSNSIGLADMFIPLEMVVFQPLWLLGFKVACSKVYFVVVTMVQLFVK
jgi:hypothetical protein